MLTRTLRRTGLPLAYSAGYHPKPILSFGPPLPLGVESSAEYFDLELTRALPEEEVKRALTQHLPARVGGKYRAEAGAEDAVFDGDDHRHCLPVFAPAENTPHRCTSQGMVCRLMVALRVAGDEKNKAGRKTG